MTAYRAWFTAAAVYNTVWGLAVVLFPEALSRLIGLDVPNAIPLVQVIGMMVGVYASVGRVCSTTSSGGRPFGALACDTHAGPSARGAIAGLAVTSRHGRHTSYRQTRFVKTKRPDWLSPTGPCVFSRFRS